MVDKCKNIMKLKDLNTGKEYELHGKIGKDVIEGTEIHIVRERKPHKITVRDITEKVEGKSNKITFTDITEKVKSGEIIIKYKIPTCKRCMKVV